MGAFGYGSSYSFKDGNLNPGMTDGMGQDPNLMNSSGGMSSMKGSVSRQAASMPNLPMSGQASDPYGINFQKDPSLDMNLAPLFGGQSDNYSQLSFLGLRNNPNSNMDPGAKIAANAIQTANPYAFGGNGRDFGLNTDSYAAGNLGGYYQQAFDYMNSAKARSNNMISDGDGNNLGNALTTGMSTLQSQYQTWLNKMLQGGSYGLNGSATYGGGF